MTTADPAIEGPSEAIAPEDVGIGQLFWAIRDAVVVADAVTGQVVLWNPAAEALFGYRMSEAVGMPVEVLVPDALKRRHRDGLAGFAATRRGPLIDAGAPVDLPALRKDGQQIAIELSLTPIDARVPGRFVLAVVRDATERARQIQHAALRAEVAAALSAGGDVDTALRRCAEAMVAHLGAAFARIWLLDEGGEVLVLRAGAGLYTRLDGAHAKVPVGRSKIGRIAAERQPYLTNDVLNDPLVSDREWVRREGLVAFAGHPLLVEGRLVGVVALFAQQPLRDDALAALADAAALLAQGIERARAEAKLAAERDLLRVLMDHLPDAVYVKDADSRFLRASRAAAALYGLADPSEAVGKTDFDFFPEGLARRLFADEQALLASDTPVLDHLERHAGRDGEERWLRATKMPLRDAQGRTTGLVGISRDVTRVKRAEDELRALNASLEARVADRTAELEQANAELIGAIDGLAAANKELEGFAYSVSHDLRAPLRAIDGFTRVIEEDFAAELPDDAARYLGRVRANAQKMGDLIDDLLAFSRLGRRDLDLRPVDPAKLAREALDDLAPAMTGRDVRVTIGDLPVSKADPAMIRQVFANLLGNAVKFTREREPARIEIEGRRTASEVVYAVRDNGVGFDPRYGDKLFGVFQRLHRAEEYEGTGVGLALVQRIVHRHGGRIWAEGRPGEGATFWFTIPSASPDAGENGAGKVGWFSRGAS